MREKIFLIVNVMQGAMPQYSGFQGVDFSEVLKLG
jgi:hypothetical protein